MKGSLSFVSLFIVLFLAFVVPLVLSRFKRLNLPTVVGEILAGILVGRSGFALVSEHDPVLDLLSMLGFVFLMFLSGMEIDFSHLGSFGSFHGREERRQWAPLPLGVTYFLFTLFLSTALGMALFHIGLIRNPWMLALILSTTSIGVVMPVLKENGLIGTPFGQTILVSSMIADFLTMLLITLLVAVLSTGLTLDILLIGILFLTFFLMHRFGMFFIRRIPGIRHAIEELSQSSSQIKVRASFALMLIFVSLSEALGAELILGAFLAGAMVSLIRTPEDEGLGNKLEAIGFGFFIPIFFIMVGVNFNLSALFGPLRSVLLAPLLLCAAVGVKLAPALIFRLRFSRRESLAAGMLMSARLSLIIAASAVGLRLGVIDESVNSAILLVAIVTVTLAPVFFARIAPPRSLAAAPIVVASTGELGLRVAERLRDHGEPVVVIGSNEEGIDRARSRGLEAVLARVNRENPDAAPYLERAKALICTSSKMNFNYQVCKLARTTYGIGHVIVQVNDPREQAKFERLGVLTLNPALDRVSMFVLIGRNPALYRLLTRTDDKEVAEVVVRDPKYTNQPLGQLQLPKGLLILAVHRKEELLVPNGKTQLQLRDKLTMAGSVDAINSVRRLFAGSVES